jgi:hypothetical protein
MSEPAPFKRRRWLSGGLAVWWLLLALQIWYAWELNEVYAACLPLLMLGPETPFAVAGLVLGVVGLVGGVRRRVWPRCCVQVLTLIASVWLLIAPPVFWLGTTLYVWRHEDRFLAEIAAARTSMSPGAVRGDVPDREGIFVEGQPPRFGFEQRWIGMFHWVAFVYDPDRTVEAQAGGRSSVFGYSMLGYDHLWGDWYVVWAMK